MLLPLTEEESTLIAAVLTAVTVPMAKEIREKILERLDPDYNSEHRYQIEAARAIYVSDDLEIDDNPEVNVAENGGDNGLWVSAWVWVYYDDDPDENADDLLDDDGDDDDNEDTD